MILSSHIPNSYHDWISSTSFNWYRNNRIDSVLYKCTKKRQQNQRTTTTSPRTRHRDKTSPTINANIWIALLRKSLEKLLVFLNRHYGQMEIMFSRCPFPADSYGWDVQLAGILADDQLYFIKPGNSILFPPTNGFRQWVDYCLAGGRQILVMTGCTLNSCVRVSSIETQKAFQHKDLQVVVDLGMCGARAGNYLPSSTFNGLSPVESAVRQMLENGVHPVKQVVWQ